MGRDGGEGMWVGRPKLILASSSPRRCALLERVGALEEVRSPNSLEPEPGDANPVEHAIALSRAKAESVAENLRKGIVLGADTVVVLDGESLGKPVSAADAGSMLGRLSGRKHQVITGMTLVDAGTGQRVSVHAETRVTFRSISREEIDAYVRTGEPLDKAGAYGVQGYGGLFVESIDGCYYNVVGLPLALLVRTLDTLVKDLEVTGRQGEPLPRRKARDASEEEDIRRDGDHGSD